MVVALVGVQDSQWRNGEDDAMEVDDDEDEEEGGDEERQQQQLVADTALGLGVWGHFNRVSYVLVQLPWAVAKQAFDDDTRLEDIMQPDHPSVKVGAQGEACPPCWSVWWCRIGG